MNNKEKYSAAEIERSKQGAIDWLADNEYGAPRSWAQEAKGTARRGYDIYEDWEAPPIAGYEELEREGLVERIGPIKEIHDEERIRFRRKVQ